VRDKRTVSQNRTANWQKGQDISMSDRVWCKTVDGKEVNLFDPDPALFMVERIANALARINRFAGHWEQPVSVARHSMRVAKLLRDAGHDTETQLQGLFHDAAEAFTTDIPSPLKKLLSVNVPRSLYFSSAMVGRRWPLSFEMFEEELLRRIFNRLEIVWPLRREVEKADKLLTERECSWVRGEDTVLYRNVSIDPEVVAYLFKHAANELFNARLQEHINGSPSETTRQI
jgi:hypothetical protein